ncbi:MAG: DnaJ domain-containing protein [Methanosphaera sp.]|nr:DnaJ domain-containing protein [Methanosphaera sp.]
MTKYIQDYYGILNVEADADNKTIKDAYECNMKKYHPDVNNGAKAQRKYELSQEAYEVLSDGDKRKEYDKLREKALANQKKKEEAQEKIDYDKSGQTSSKKSKSPFKGKGRSSFKGKKSKSTASNAFDLINNVGKSGNLGKVLSAGAKSGSSSSLLSLSKLVLGGAATAYGVKKGRDYMAGGGKNQK